MNLRCLLTTGLNIPTIRSIFNSKSFILIQRCQFNATAGIRFNQTPNESNEDTRRYKIYTKTGDKGKSSLFTGERRPKDDLVFDALGNTDELNSSIGLAREFCTDIINQTERVQVKKACMLVDSQLVKIQSILLDIGSHIATPKTKAQQKQLDRLRSFDAALTSQLENWVDTYELELPVLKNFILPSGGKCASTIHLARAICRRLERSMQPLAKSNDLDPNVCVFVNRLSDFLFVLARFVSMKEGKVETIYKKV